MSAPRIFTVGSYDQGTYDQIVRCAGEDGYGVLCADNHLGYSQPIGGAVAYEHHISPSGVGYDIGCGNKAVQTPLSVDDVDIPGIMDEIVRRISFGVGRPAQERADHEVLDRIAQAAPLPEMREMAPKAAEQLGTIGGGNHYVDLFKDAANSLWVGVHFGSRGFGHKTASGFLALAQGKKFGARVGEGGMDAPPTLLDTRTPLGEAYIEAMTLAGDYAYAGRDVVVDKVLEILGTESMYEVHNHHNFAWKEYHPLVHPTEPVWVVRKGCTPAYPGQEGFVGGSMGDMSVILKGRDDYEGGAEPPHDGSEAAKTLFSTVHGAGRRMGRREAAGRTRKRWACTNRDCDWVQPPHTHKPESGRCPKCGKDHLTKRWVEEAKGAIDWDAALDDIRRQEIELRGGAADEAPGAYKRLPEVLDAHSESIEVLTELRPVGVAMAGAGVARDD